MGTSGMGEGALWAAGAGLLGPALEDIFWLGWVFGGFGYLWSGLTRFVCLFSLSCVGG